MKFLINHKEPKQKFQDHRLIFFANEDHSLDASLSSVEGGYIDSLEARAEDPDSPKWMRDNLGIIAQKARGNKMSLKLLRQISEAIDRGDKYTGNQQFQDFIRALARNNLGELKEKGEGMFFFVEMSMKGTDAQKVAAKMVIEKYAHRERENQKIRQKDIDRYTNIIVDAELYDDLSHVRNLVDGTSLGYENSLRERALAIAETADTHSKVEQASQVSESTVLEEKFPAETMKLLKEGMLKDKKLMDELNVLRNRALPIDRELDQLHQEGNKDFGRVKDLERKQSALNKQIEKLERKRQELLDNLEQPEEARINYDKRMKNRFEVIKYLSRELGFDVSKPGTEITCTLANGQVVKRKIVNIVFHSGGKSAPPDSSLTPYIVYEEDGKRMGPPHHQYLNFIRDIVRDDGYVDIESIEQLTDDVSHEAAGETIAVNQQFTSNIDHSTFTITDISKDGKITLDRSVISRHAHELRQDTTPADQLQDTESQVFNFGQFATLLRRQNYRRSDIRTDDLPTAAARVHEALKERCLAINHSLEPGEKRERHIKAGGLPPEKGFIPPKNGESALVYVIKDDQIFQENWTPTLDNKGQTVYHRERVRLYPYSPEALLNAGVSPRFASKKNPVMDDRDIDPDSPIGKYKPLEPIPASQMLDMVRDGNVINVPPALLSKGSFKLDPNASKVRALAVSDEKFDFDENADTSAVAEPVVEEPLSKEEMELKDKTSNAIRERSIVPYDQAHKVGGMNFEEESYISKLWADTRFFAAADIWEMGKSMWEYYDRRFARKQKEKYSSIGKHLPYFAPEMQRVNQFAETEEVNQFKETFQQKGVLEIRERLRITRNQDEMKAAFQVLSEKGQIRWDDVGMWKNLNRFVSASNQIPIPIDGDPYRIITDNPNDPNFNRTGVDYIKGAIDSLWGEGGYDDWKNSNQSQYASKAASYEEEGKELGSVPGSHTTRLGELLRAHKAGEFVDAHRYEGLILHAIRDGKTTMQAKLFYIIEGVAAVNKDGRTIMPFDRVGHIEGKYIANFPILNHLTGGAPNRENGENVPYTLEDFKKWVRIFDDGDPNRYQPGLAVHDFLWDQVITSETTKTRINKALRNGEGIDHDDYYAYLPPATEEQVTDATKGISGGGKKFLTVEGYKNCFPGFSQLMRTLADKGESKRLAQAVVSYVRFESIMTNRYEKGNDTYQRMTDELDRECVMDAHTPRHFMGQLNKLVDQVVEAYANSPGGAELIDVVEKMRREVDIRVLNTPAGKKQQDEVNAALKRFNSVFTRTVNSDGGAKLTARVHDADRRKEMSGMTYSNDLERAKGKVKEV